MRCVRWSITVVYGAPYELGTYRYAGSCATFRESMPGPSAAYTLLRSARGIPGSGSRNGGATVIGRGEGVVEPAVVAGDVETTGGGLGVGSDAGEPVAEQAAATTSTS